MENALTFTHQNISFGMHVLKMEGEAMATELDRKSFK